MSIGMSMLRSFGGLSRRALWQRKGRSILTAAGVTLGVALFFGSLVSNQSGLAAMDRALNASTGSADVLITPVGDNRQAVLDGTMGERIAKLPDVEAAAGVMAVPTTVKTPSGRALRLVYNHPRPAFLVGAEPDEVDSIYRFTYESGRPVGSDRNEVVITDRLAEKLALRAGDRATIATPLGDRPVVVSGILSNSGAGRFNQGNVVFTSLDTARALAGRVGAVSQVFIDLKYGVDGDEWIDRHGAEIGRGVNIEAAGDAGFGRQQLVAFGVILNMVGATILFVAGFLIYLTLSTAVVERVRLYGTLRSIGARRSQVRRLVIGEALLIGSISTALGLALGFGVAAGLIAASRRIFAFSVDSTPLTISPTVVVAAAALGIVTTVVSALLPARRAARLDPVEAMRGDFATQVRLSRAWMVGIIAFVAGAGLLTFGSRASHIGLASPLILFGSNGVLPLVLRPIARVVGAVTSRFARGVGDVAVLHLAKERTRSGYTLALVMVVMATAIVVGAANESFTRSINDQITREFGADLRVEAASTFPPGFAAELERIEGVSVVTPFAIGESKILSSERKEQLAQVRFIDPNRHFETGSFAWRDGDETAAKRALAKGETVFPFAAAERLGLRRGDDVTLRTSEGPRSFRIGVTADISNAIATMYFGWDTGRRYFGIDNPSVVLVKASRGADVDALRKTIEDDLGSKTMLLVSTMEDIRADVRAQIAGGLNSFTILLILAGVLGLVGLTNTMAVSMLQRYREIGLLRAIGARKRQVRGMALVESSTLVAVAFVLAVPLGAFLSVPIVKFSTRIIGDLTIHYYFPWKLLPVLAVAGVIAAAVTAIGPARQATQLDIETALRFE